MGLIKTAMMTGGGLYAVNRLARVAENRASAQGSGQRQGQGQTRDAYYQQGQSLDAYDQQYQTRGAYDQQQYEQDDWSRSTGDSRRSQPTHPERWYSPQDDAWYPYPPDHQAPPYQASDPYARSSMPEPPRQTYPALEEARYSASSGEPRGDLVQKVFQYADGAMTQKRGRERRERDGRGRGDLSGGKGQLLASLLA